MNLNCKEMSIKKVVEMAYRGYPEAELELGFRYLHGIDVGQDKKEAIMWLTKAAEHKSSDACFILGEMYYDVYDQNAEYWLLRAASLYQINYSQNVNKGFSAFQCYEILYNYFDYKFIKDADEWLEKAMDAEYVEAYLEMARRYLFGENIKQNIKKSGELYGCVLRLAEKDENLKRMINNNCEFLKEVIEHEKL